MSNNERFNDILNECLDRMLKGETVEQCLKSHPELAKELEPLLHTAQVAKMASSIQPRAEFKAKARHEFQSALRNMESKKKPHASWFQWRWRWQSGWAIAVVVIIVIVLSGGGTVFAASNSMPDDTLYSVKLATEHVQLALTFSDVGKAELNAKMADTRVDEIINMAAKGDTQNVMVAAQNLNNNLQNLTNLAGDANGNTHQTDAASGTTGSTTNSSASNEQSPMMAASAPEPSPTTPPQALAVPGAVVPTAPSQPPTAQSGNNQVGAAGTQIYPAAGTVDVPQKPVFRWAAVNGAVSYDLQVADNPVFAHPIEFKTGLKNPVWTEIRILDFGKTYYWRVRAVSASHVPGDWIARQFTVMPAPVAGQPAVVPLHSPVVPAITGNSPAQPAPTYSLNVPSPASGPEATAGSSGALNGPDYSSPVSKDSQNKSAGNLTARNSNNSNNRTSNNANTKDKEKIRQIIIDNAVSYQSKLEAALSKAPDQVRPAIRQAITQSQVQADKALQNLDQDETDTDTQNVN